MNDLEGMYLGRYHVIEQLGRGGMATVYKAFDTQLERSVAIKVLLQHEGHSAQFLARFKREAKILAMLSHPNIVRVLDYGEQDAIPFLVMDYVSGGNLASSVQRPLDWRKTAELLLPIARALHYAHIRGIVHRDVKPSNILLSDSGEPMLSDFGISKMLEHHKTVDLTRSAVGIGTPEYMAPEQVSGNNVDYRVDIYALGVVFFEMVTGVRPYTADTPLAVLLKQHNQPLPRPRQYVPNMPEDVERFIFKLMAKDPDLRYQNMYEVALALEKIAQGVPLSKVEAPLIPVTGEEVPRQRAQNWLPLAFGVVGLVALGFLGLMALLLVQSLQPPKVITITGGLESPPAVEFASVSAVSGLVEILSSDGTAVPVEDKMKLMVSGPFRLRASDGQIRLNLLDGSVICVHPKTEVEFLKIAEASPGQPEFHLNLMAGKLLFVDSGELRSLFVIDKPFPITISSLGAVIGLEKKGIDSPRLDLDCLDGSCSFESSPIRMDLMSAGHVWLESAGGFSSMGLPRSEMWGDVCADLIYQRVAGVPTPTPGSLLDFFSRLVEPISLPLADTLGQLDIQPTVFAADSAQSLPLKPVPTRKSWWLFGSLFSRPSETHEQPERVVEVEPPTNTPGRTITPVPTHTPSPTGTVTPTLSPGKPSVTPTLTPVVVWTRRPTRTPTRTFTRTGTPTRVGTVIITATKISTSTLMDTQVPTLTEIVVPTNPDAATPYLFTETVTIPTLPTGWESPTVEVPVFETPTEWVQPTASAAPSETAVIEPPMTEPPDAPPTEVLPLPVTEEAPTAEPPGIVTDEAQPPTQEPEPTVFEPPVEPPVNSPTEEPTLVEPPTEPPPDDPLA